MNYSPYPKDLPVLTSLRFFAALAVIVYHFGYFLPAGYSRSDWFMRDGYLAVDFFFILSGFILMHTYGEAFEAQRLTRSSFYLRRFARVYPMHLLTLLAMSAVLFIGVDPQGLVQWNTALEWGSFLNHLLLIHAWGIESSLRFNMPSWSISAEWFAYLLFPFVAFWVGRVRPHLFLGLAVLLFLSLWVGLSLGSGRPLTARTYDFSILRILPEFLMGMALYRVRVSEAPMAFPRILFVGAVIALASISFVGAPSCLLVLCFLPIIGAGAELSRARQEGVLKHPVLLYLGEASYAMYMVHFIFMVLVVGPLQKYYPSYVVQFPAVFLGVTVLIVGSSAGFYRYFEVPARKWIAGNPQTSP